MATIQALIDSVVLMCGVQAVGAAICLIGAIVQLRPGYRVLAEGVANDPLRHRINASWRLRARPPVDDDPIFWRERYTNRTRGLARLFDVAIYCGIAAAIAYPTWFFGVPALREVWSHGYASGLTSGERPEFNLFVRFFSNSATGLAIDQSRIDFNIFLRFITVSFSLFIIAGAAGLGADAIIAERSRETWTSLLATPLSAPEILRAKTLASFWRIRLVLGTMVVLWTLGLIAGAIHPLGYVLSLLILFSWTRLMIGWGLLCAIKATVAEVASIHGIAFAYLLIVTALFPFFLPARISSVLFGSLSSPFVLWLAELSYRDLRNAIHYSAVPHLHWIGIETGEGSLRVVATCLIGIITPSLGGWFVRRYALAHFDRLAGRPWRKDAVEASAVSKVPAKAELA